MGSTTTAAAPTKVSVDHSLFARWGRFAFRRRWALLVASLLVMAIGGIWGTGVISALSQGGFNDPAAQSTKAAAVLAKDFARSSADAIIIYSAPSGSALTVDSPAFSQAITRVAASLPAAKVIGFATYWNTGLNPAFVTPDHRTTYAIVRLAGADETARAQAYADVAPKFLAQGLVTQRGGNAAIQETMTTTIQKDIARAETMSFIALGILLVIVFGSAVASTLPLAIGGIAPIRRRRGPESPLHLLRRDPELQGRDRAREWRQVRGEGICSSPLEAREEVVPRPPACPRSCHRRAVSHRLPSVPSLPHFFPLSFVFQPLLRLRPLRGGALRDRKSVV